MEPSILKIKPISENKSLRNLQKLLREVIAEEHASVNSNSRVIKEYFKRNDFIAAFDNKVDAPKPNFSYGSPEEEIFSPKPNISNASKPVLGEGPVDENDWSVAIEEQDNTKQDTPVLSRDAHERFFEDVVKRLRTVSPSAYSKAYYLETDEGMKIDTRFMNPSERKLVHKLYFDAWFNLDIKDKKALGNILGT